MTPFAMLYTVAAGVPIALAALAIAAVLRRYGRPERGVWLGALVLSLMVPAFALVAPATTSGAATPSADIGVIGLPEFVVVPAQGSSLDWSAVFLMAWLAASLALAIRWFVAAYRLSRTSRDWSSTTIDGVEVRVTPDVGPAVAGTLRPRVLAPSWLASMPARERVLVLMHEEEHIRAHDPMLIAFTRLARVLVPWNPVVWLLSSRLVRAVELDCDRRVLRRTSDVAAYGHTLLTVSKRRPGRLAAVAAFAESEAPLRNRILSMTTPPRAISIAAITGATILGVVLLVGVLEIPVPTIALDVAIGPPLDQVASVPASEAPPLPPPAPPNPAVVPSQLVPLPPPPPPAPVVLAPAVESNEPENTVIPQTRVPGVAPRIEQPLLTNMAEVQRALMDNYPAELRDAGIGGAPVLWVHITADGTVDETRVLESTWNEALDEAAERVARVMRFRPAENTSGKTDSYVVIPIRFAVVN